jgi:predicted RNA-binding Zn-ribbon protein involved in translation (DUF1610 family)
MVTQGLIFKKNPIYEKCPSCTFTGSLRKSRARTLWEKIIKNITPLGFYRCKKCGWRGYRMRFILTKKSLKNAFVYLILVLISAFIINQILKRFV